LSQESLAEELRNADLLVHTSKFETFGLVVVEANACGLPVLTLNNGPMKELVSNNVNGFISDHFTNDQLKIFVNNIFYDKKESIEIKKSSFKKSKEYSWEKTGKKFSELYNALI
jgi:glycosyltransferase involved in cell wall biosynthesis